MKKPTVYLVIGVAGAGKTWLCKRLGGAFNYVPHDRCWTHPSGARPGPQHPNWGPPGSKSTHLETIVKEAKASAKPVVTEVPFGERRLRDELVSQGLKVVPVFVVEDAATVAKRYADRERKPIPPAAAARVATMKARAEEWKAFSGTSQEVLDHLKALREPKSMADAAEQSLER